MKFKVLFSLGLTLLLFAGTASAGQVNAEKIVKRGKIVKVDMKGNFFVLEMQGGFLQYLRPDNIKFLDETKVEIPFSKEKPEGRDVELIYLPTGTMDKGIINWGRVPYKAADYHSHSHGGQSGGSVSPFYGGKPQRINSGNHHFVPAKVEMKGKR